LRVSQVRLPIILAGLAGVNVLLVFFYQWYILTIIGPGWQTDALFAGMTVPQLMLAVVSGSMTHVLVPLLAVEKEESFKREAWNIFQTTIFIFGILALILFLLSAIWVPWLVPGFDRAGKLLTVSMVRIQLVGMIFVACNGVLRSTYNARKRFIWAELSPAFASIVGLIFLVWGLPSWGVIIAAWAMVIRGVVEAAFLIPVLGSYRLPNLRSRVIKDTWRRLYPLLLGTTYYKTDQLVDRILSSLAPAGQLSLLYFANQIYSAGNLILSKALVGPVVPVLAEKAFNKDWHLFQDIVRKRTLTLLCITLGAYSCILLFGDSILQLLFGHGRFDTLEILNLRWILVALVGVWVGGAVGQVLTSSFYAKGNTRTPTKIGIFGFTLGLGLKLVGFLYCGILGIAVGTSIYYLFNAFLLKYFLSRRLGKYS